MSEIIENQDLVAPSPAAVALAVLPAAPAATLSGVRGTNVVVAATAAGKAITDAPPVVPPHLLVIAAARAAGQDPVHWTGHDAGQLEVERYRSHGKIYHPDSAGAEGIDGQALVLPELFRRDSIETVTRALEFFHVALNNPKTGVQYQQAVAGFCRWMGGKNVTSLRDVQPIHVAQFIVFRRSQVAAPTVKAELAAIRSWFNYLTAGGHLPHNPAASVKGPRHSRTEGKTPGMTTAEAGRLLKSLTAELEDGEGVGVGPADRLKAIRDKAIISLMLYSACRVGAVCASQVEDFYQTGTDFNMNLHEKGGKDRTLVLHHKAAEAVHAWVEAAGITGERKTPLFRSMPNQLKRQERPFSERGMRACDAWDMVKARCEGAGLSSRFGNHSFRVTALTNLLENGGTLDEAQRLAGHADARTTALYDRRSRAVARSTVERINYS